MENSHPQTIPRLRLTPGLRLDSSDAIMIMCDDARRRIVHVNPAFVRLTGFGAGDWLGSCGDLLDVRGPLRMDALLWLDTEGDGRELHWIARLNRRDGVQFCGEAHLHPVPGNATGPGYLVLVLTDVTSRVGSAKTRPAKQLCSA